MNCIFFSWIASRQHEPIQMWDAFNGTLRCSYRGYNAVDEVESALSITFSSDGLEVIGGYKKSIKIFQTNVPGRDYTSVPIKSPSSALAVNNGNTNYLAVGSWTGMISLYDTRHLNRDVIDQFAGHTGGITFLKFLHGDNYLVSGARKDNKLLMWDIRNSFRPVLELNREVTTNQRIYFDVSEDGKWLASGDTNGLIHAWDISEKTTAHGFKVCGSFIELFSKTISNDPIISMANHSFIRFSSRCIVTAATVCPSIRQSQFWRPAVVNTISLKLSRKRRMLNRMSETQPSHLARIVWFSGGAVPRDRQKNFSIRLIWWNWSVLFHSSYLQ